MAANSELIVIVDDDELIAQAFSTILDAAGWRHRKIITDPRSVLDFVRANEIAAILLDLHMPHIDGRELLASISAERPEVPVIILTLEDRVDVAVECMKQGAFDFMTKPIDEARLLTSVSHAIRVHDLHNEVRILSRRAADIDIAHPEHFASIVTASEAMRQLFGYIETIAPTHRSVLITGESGTGKELFARALHAASGRSGQFVPVNVAGLDDTVFSDTLFGHRRGAFTGADGTRRGLVEQAASGTLFLDEIGDLDNGAQLKLLRLLQEDEYYALGSDTPERSTARVVAATNADLQKRQGDGSFRRDLFYRLMGHHLEIPPLRERPEDIPTLLDHFARESYESLGFEPKPVGEGVDRLLVRYGFPGNVRELQAIIFDIVSRARGEAVGIQEFAAHPLLSQEASSQVAGRRLSYTGPIPTLEEAESFLIAEALERSGGNQTAAAKLLGVSQSTLSRRLARDRD